jgi:hypothetical protein
VVGVARNGKSVRTPAIDMSVIAGPDASQGVDGIPGRGALTFTLNGALQSGSRRMALNEDQIDT